MGGFCFTSRQRGGKISIDATLISTVYNEAKTIEDLLESIQKQTRTPNEIVIVDGGSTDGTWSILQNFAENKENVRIIQQEGCNIAEGRNLAVSRSSNDYIASTDAGCVLDETWFDEIVKKFESGSKYVIGMFKPFKGDKFQRAQGKIVCSPHTVEELQKGNRGPSSRSVGFSKKAWKEAGGYPENLYTGEDSQFNAKILAAGYEPAIAENAIVYWRMRPTWRSFFKQFYQYGEGDAQGGNLFIHPSQKLGVSKNFWLLSNHLLTILLLSLFTASLFIQSGHSSFIFIAGVLSLSIPTLYYLTPLVQVTKEDGLKGLLIGIGVTQVKSWAYFAGFIKEIIGHPSLFLKQFMQAKKL